MSSAELLRAGIFHTPANPFTDANALQVHEDGALVIADGRIAACGDYSEVRQRFAEITEVDLRGCIVLPGFVDTHVHYPQVRIIGGFGHTLLDWLGQLTLPEEARLADLAYARELARDFVGALASHGTTTALVFGSHFCDATAALFEASAAAGLRIRSGLVVSDRLLLPELHTDADVAYRENKALIDRFHGHGRLSYAVTPRFALSVSEPMLDVCAALLAEHPDITFQSHINENALEIDAVCASFPWATSYLSVYDRFGLVGPRSLFAHNVHVSDDELARMADTNAAVAHCPCSNAALGSGIFPMHRHLEAGVRFGLGSDVGAGTGFGMVKEALQAYLQQRVAVESLSLTPAQMLYLATLAGAEALGLGRETGDFMEGKSADIVCLRPKANRVLAGVIQHTENPVHRLAAIFSLAGQETIEQVRVAGRIVYCRGDEA